MVWASVFVMATLAGMVQSITGFGGGIVMMLVLPYFFDMLAAPAIGSAVSIGTCGALAWRFRKHIDFKLVGSSAIIYIACSIGSIYLAQGMDLRRLSLWFGIFLVALALYFFLFSKKAKFSSNWKTAIFCSAASGITSGLFGIGGPLIALYYVSATKDKETYIGSLECLFTLAGGINLVIRMFRGIYTLDLIPITIFGMLVTNLGKLVGLRIVGKLNADTFRKVVYVFVAVSGVLTIIQNL